MAVRQHLRRGDLRTGSTGAVGPARSPAPGGGVWPTRRAGRAAVGSPSARPSPWSRTRPRAARGTRQRAATAGGPHATCTPGHGAGGGSHRGRGVVRACVTCGPRQRQRAHGPLLDRGRAAGRLESAMPSQRTARSARGAVVEQRGGQCMAQQMRPRVRRREPGPCQRSAPDRPDRVAIGNATARRPHPDTDPPCRAGRAAVPEGGDSCVADLVWPWETSMARALAPDEEFPRVPLQIIQGQGRHFTSPSPKTGPWEHKRGIAWPWSCRPVTALPQGLDVLGFQTRGEG